jgi:hypothetical protein
MKRSTKGIILSIALAYAVSGCANSITCAGYSGDDLKACQFITFLVASGLGALLIGAVAVGGHHHHHSIPGNVATGSSCTPNC